MAKRRASSADDITLYDIDPVFQDKLIAWLTQKPKGVIVDIGATPEAFAITLDPGGTFLDESFEHVLSTSMGSRSKKKYIDPELENRIHMFLHATKARLTFGASKDGVFNMTVSNPDSRGTASDEDFEFALVIAEEKFWQNMPARPKVPIVTFPAPMIGPEARGAMLDETLPPGMAQYFQPRPTLSLPARPSLSPSPAQTPGGFVGAWQTPAARPAPARPALPAPKPKPKPKSTPLKFPLVSPTVPVMTSLGQAPSFFGGSTPPPGQFISKNGDPRERRRRFMVTSASGRGSVSGPRGEPRGIHSFDHRSLEDARRWADNRGLSAPEANIVEYFTGSEQDPYVFADPNQYTEASAYPDYEYPRVGRQSRYYDLQENARRPPPPPPSSRPFDPSVPPVRYAKPHHFAVNVPGGRHSPGGSWRIHLAGGDVARGAHADYDEAAQEARHTYGPSGWTVEWHAAGR